MKGLMGVGDQRIVAFIRTALQKGNSRKEIEDVLLKKGWKEAQVEEAFAEVRSSSQGPSVQPSRVTSVKKPLTQSALFWVFLLFVALFVVGVLVYFVFPWKEGCSSDRDCGSGYECDEGACVLEQGTCLTDRDCGRGEECSYGECVSVGEEPDYQDDDIVECTIDSQCVGGYACSSTGKCYDVCTSTSGCASGYTCSAGSCVQGSGGGTSSGTGEENYTVHSAVLSPTSLDDYTLGYFFVNVSHTGDTSSGNTSYLFCSFTYENGTALATHTPTLSTISLGRSSLEDCSLVSSVLYLDVVSVGVANITLNATVDSTGTIAESVETDNSLVASFTVRLANYSVTSSTSCTNASSCGGYACAVDGMCFAACTDLGGECATGYSCSSGSCVVDTGTTSSCVEADCTALGYTCDSSTDACYSLCTDDSSCASGYTCVSSVCTEETVSCPETLPTCADGEDNDGDGLVDLDDTDDCAEWGEEEDEGSEESCSDSDSTESDPYLVSGTVIETSADGTEEEYTDGCVGDRLTEYFCAETAVDNSQDLCTDLYDASYFCEDGACVNSCSSDDDCSEGYVCSDGVCSISECTDLEDNDEDGLADYLGVCYRAYGSDFTCSDYFDDYEDCYSSCSSVTIDGKFVSGDYACSSSADDTEALSSCMDGDDNDGDGKVDYYGACDTDLNGEADLSCVDLFGGESSLDYYKEEGMDASELSGYCRSLCETSSTEGGYGGVYIEEDNSCTSEEDDDEALQQISRDSSSLKITTAPPLEDNRGFFARFFEFFFMSEPVLDFFE